MTYPRTAPAYRLHTLVARLDAAADAMLRTEHGISYARFLPLLTIDRLESSTQAEIAREHGITEPAASRMIRSLAEQGLVTTVRTPGAGNRRAVGLTEAGERLVADGGLLLESAFARLLAAAGVHVDDVHAVTEPVLAVLEGVPA